MTQMEQMVNQATQEFEAWLQQHGGDPDEVEAQDAADERLGGISAEAGPECRQALLDIVTEDTSLLFERVGEVAENTGYALLYQAITERVERRLIELRDRWMERELSWQGD